MNSREKGAVGERELAGELNRIGMIARRTVQYCGKGGDAADVVAEGLDLHIEVKRCERVKLADWIAQAQRDARARDWVVFTRQNNRPWLCACQCERCVQFESNCPESHRLPAQCCLLYTSPSPRDGLLSRMPSSA